jgi:hypothetical protein
MLSFDISTLLKGISKSDQAGGGLAFVRESAR